MLPHPRTLLATPMACTMIDREMILSDEGLVPESCWSMKKLLSVTGFVLNSGNSVAAWADAVAAAIAAGSQGVCYVWE